MVNDSDLSRTLAYNFIMSKVKVKPGVAARSLIKIFKNNQKQNKTKQSFILLNFGKIRKVSWNFIKGFRRYYGKKAVGLLGTPRQGGVPCSARASIIADKFAVTSTELFWFYALSTTRQCNSNLHSFSNKSRYLPFLTVLHYSL